MYLDKVDVFKKSELPIVVKTFYMQVAVVAQVVLHRITELLFV